MSARSRAHQWWGPRVARHPLIHLTPQQVSDYAFHAFDTLQAMDRGEMPMFMAVPLEFCGYPEYVAANGWRFQVFDDCDEFDYIDHAVSPDGVLFDWISTKHAPERHEDHYFEPWWPFWPVFHWGPTHEARWGYNR